MLLSRTVAGGGHQVGICASCTPLDEVSQTGELTVNNGTTGAEPLRALSAHMKAEVLSQVQ